MQWYEGSIAEAVTSSKQRNAIFVVFVEGDNDLSTEMAATLDDEAVISRLSNETNFLAVKLKSGTVNYTHFAQIYQFVPVPSLFFIGRNGTPLEVVCAGVEASNLATRIDRILAEHHSEKLASGGPSTSTEVIINRTTRLSLPEMRASTAPQGYAAAVKVEPPAPQKVEPPASQKVEPPASQKVEPPASQKVEPPASQKVDPPAQQKLESEPSSPPAKIQKMQNVKPSPELEVVCDGDVCVRRPKTSEPGASGQGASTSGQGQRHVAQPVTATAEKPVSGSALQGTPSTSGGDEKMDRVKELLEAKRRENAEKEKELERQKELERRNVGQGVVELKRWQAEQELKQIQDERKREKMENNLARQRILEQIAQDRAERRARDSAPPAPAAPPHEPAPPAPPATSGDAHSSARIQFKLPDGSTHTASFDASDTLSRVQDYVADKLQRSRSFSLWTAFPRRELCSARRTLAELQLAPSAALLVLPRRAAAAPPAAAAPASFSVFAFITQLLSSLIYEPTVQLYTWLRTRLFPPPAVTPRTPTSPPQPARPPTAATQLRRRANIHRLPGDASDDDNNTWNGNSTQQM